MIFQSNANDHVSMFENAELVEQFASACGIVARPTATESHHDRFENGETREQLRRLERAPETSASTCRRTEPRCRIRSNRPEPRRI